MEKIRSFIAIELPDDLRRELGRLQRRLRVDRPRVKWVSPEGIHLTLKFLGDIDTGMIEPITQAMHQAAQEISPFNLDVQQLGAFPNFERVQVVWVGLGGEADKLKQLCSLLETNLSRLGFAAEQRPFTPHLTLARLGNEASFSERQRFGELIAGTKLELDYNIKVDALSLIKSQLTSAGAVYSRIGLAELNKSLPS
jgi:2'-5' RNA ligase